MAKLHPIDAETPWQRTWRRRSAIAARSIGCAVVFIGLLGLTGWWAGIGVLRTVLPGLAQMKPNVGAALVLAGGGLSLGVFGVRRRRVRIALGALGALIGAATLVEYALGLGDVIDSLLVPGVAPRMTAASAVALTVGGCGVVLTALPSRAGPAPVRAGVETALAALVMVTGTLGLLGYLYGAGPMYHTKAFSSMALHTALALTLLGTGLVLCKPTQGLARLLGSEGAGGVLARRLIGFFVLLTPVLGWVRLKGEDLGFYDTPFGLALMLAMTMVVGIAMVWWTAGALDRTDAWRATLQEDLAASVSREHATAAQRGAILNGLPAAVALLGPDGRVAAVNQRWESVLVDPDQRAGVVGSCFADWGGNALGVDGEEWGAVAQGVANVLAGREQAHVAQARARPSQGPADHGPAAADRSRWLEVRVAAVTPGGAARAGTGRWAAPGGAVVMVSDATEQRRLEEQLVHAQRLEAVGRLAGGVAHDFNNLLTAVSGHCSIAQARLAEGHGVSEELEAIELAARSGAELTQQLLALGRRQVITPRVVSAAELIGDVRRLIERSLGEAVRLRIEGAPDLWPARADPARIEQVILNLVINARDAIPQGRDGGAVIIEAGNAVLDESYAAARPGVTPGRYVCLSVSDNGVGMTKEVLARVFEPFFTTKERGRGTGLGLATSFGIVRQHGGHIAVYSEPGVGSTFRVYLPAAVGEAVASRARADAPPARGRERVLLIDDHEGARDAVAGMLRMLGYTVTQAADGAGARRAVEALAGALDLVVCDVMLPDGTGPEVVEHLRAVAGWPEPAPPVVFISGYTANAVAQHGVVEPAVRFIAKPFTAQELGQLVRSALDGRSAPRAGA